MDTMSLFRRTLLGLIGTAVASLLLLWGSRFHDLLDLVRRAMVTTAGAFLLVVALAASARANELGTAAGPTGTGLVLHDAAETWKEWCRADADGRLWLVLPSGVRYELVTSTGDPAVANPGDGSFHSFDLDVVRAAIAGCGVPLDGLAAHVFLLPFPRRAGLESAAGPGLVLLSPGVLPLSREQQHAEVAHELGHVFQYARMPDEDLASWDRYRVLRGIVDPTIYDADAPHQDRPHEIFAEDFRALFGGALANYSGSIENETLAPPQQVPGLVEFFRALSSAGAGPRLAATPNPARGPVTFARSGGEGAAVDLFDVAGRRIATLAPTQGPAGPRWIWDGVAAGDVAVVFARERGTSTISRVTRLR